MLFILIRQPNLKVSILVDFHTSKSRNNQCTFCTDLFCFCWSLISRTFESCWSDFTHLRMDKYFTDGRSRSSYHHLFNWKLNERISRSIRKINVRDDFEWFRTFFATRWKIPVDQRRPIGWRVPRSGWIRVPILHVCAPSAVSHIFMIQTKAGTVHRIIIWMSLNLGLFHWDFKHQIGKHNSEKYYGFWDFFAPCRKSQVGEMGSSKGWIQKEADEILKMIKDQKIVQISWDFFRWLGRIEAHPLTSLICLKKINAN